MTQSKKRKQKRTFLVRKFLNRSGYHSVASIYATVSERTDLYKDKQGKMKEEFWIDADLVITDCKDRISLCMDSGSKEDRRNTLHKLDLLTDTLIQFREAVRQGFAKEEEYEKRGSSP